MESYDASEKKWIAEREVREMRGLQKEIWRHATTAAHIGSDPDALFLFFTQRVYLKTPISSSTSAVEAC
jgi:hypothetical protein